MVLINGINYEIGEIIKRYPNYANSNAEYYQIIKFTNQKIAVRKLKKNLISEQYNIDSSCDEIVSYNVNNFEEDCPTRYIKKDNYDKYNGEQISIWIDGR
jgi:hypothetical protein